MKTLKSEVVDQPLPKPQASMAHGGERLMRGQSAFVSSTGLYWTPTSHSNGWKQDAETIAYRQRRSWVQTLGSECHAIDRHSKFKKRGQFKSQRHVRLELDQ
jgi:hypothetical protein